MYKGKMTLFYNGETLWAGDDEVGQSLVYNEQERDSWEVIIVLPGVEIIPAFTFYDCENIQVVIMADSVKRIENEVFQECHSLVFVKLSRNLEYIGGWAFYLCTALTSIFIPPSCEEINQYAFSGCTKLLILGMPQNVELGEGAFQSTTLMKKSPLEINDFGDYHYDREEEAVQWIKSINNEEANALHRACASYNPLPEIIHALVRRQGLQAMRMPNTIGITPSQYLAANTFADISEKDIINRYIPEMMGEVI